MATNKNHTFQKKNTCKCMATAQLLATIIHWSLLKICKLKVQATIGNACPNINNINPSAKGHSILILYM